VFDRRGLHKHFDLREKNEQEAGENCIVLGIKIYTLNEISIIL
jgi:hypothetical protein